MIHGTTVILYNKEVTERNAMNEPVYDWFAHSYSVDDVLVGEPTPQEKIDEMTMTGKQIAFTLGIPKGDTHDWTDQVVEFFGCKFRTFGIPQEGIEANIPLRWHKKVKCERYE